MFDKAGIMEVLGEDAVQQNVGDAMLKIERARRSGGKGRERAESIS